MNAIRDPSGESAGFNSADSVDEKRFSVPSGERIQMCDAFPAPRMKAIVPSGASVGAPSGSVEFVMRSGMPAVPSALTFTRQRAYVPERSEEKTIDDPSRDHEGSQSHAIP